MKAVMSPRREAAGTTWPTQGRMTKVELPISTTLHPGCQSLRDTPATAAPSGEPLAPTTSFFLCERQPHSMLFFRLQGKERLGLNGCAYMQGLS
eukprot:1146279-Pelagomonas_calceolata.AAC.8